MIRFLRKCPAPEPSWIVGTVFDVLTEAIHEGGISGDEIVARLRERGVAVSASELETHGLSTVAEATEEDGDA